MRRGTPCTPKPTAYAGKRELSGKDNDGIYALTDNATDDQFEAALEAARNDGPLDKDGKPRGNVSRANVVRKIKSATEAPARLASTRRGLRDA